MANAMQGIIAIWSGAIVDIPFGWKLCDGDNGTPDLRDKFVVGAGSTYDPTDTGGAVDHTHAATQASHYHDIQQVAGNIGGPGAYLHATNSKTPVITVPTVEHLPPYYALCYIMHI